MYTINQQVILDFLGSKYLATLTESYISTHSNKPCWKALGSDGTKYVYVGTNGSEKYTNIYDADQYLLDKYLKKQFASTNKKKKI